MSSAILETVSGKKIDITNPDPNDIDIVDIAWGLSRIPRFCGATIPLIPYSVAQHSIQVMEECGVLSPNKASVAALKMHGLLHDAAEAYISDIPSPVKHIPGIKEKIKEVENNLIVTIYKAFNITLPNEGELVIVHKADLVQQAIEAYNFMYSRGKEWKLPPISFQKLQEFKEPMKSIDAYECFCKNFNELRNLI
jgi:5'-deoxynucleotidase YfbR-like HD superfamily hydrolase